jgi:major membrane immunogen (membrane-anchored lipoprotein)
MKRIMGPFAFAMLSSVLIAGCGKSPDNDLNTRTPEQQTAADNLYKDMDQPTDRTKSKEY